MDQFKSLKQPHLHVFLKFVGQFDLEGSQFLRIVQYYLCEKHASPPGLEDLEMINTQLKFEGKIHRIQKLLHSGIVQYRPI